MSVKRNLFVCERLPITVLHKIIKYYEIQAFVTKQNTFEVKNMFQKSIPVYMIYTDTYI